MEASNSSLKDIQFENIVFAGGGNRCFWQAGFWSVIQPALALTPKRVSAVSAGSAISCSIFAERMNETLAAAKNTMTHNLKNQYWTNIFKGKRVFPHEALYRKMVLDIIDDGALQNLSKGPEIYIEISRLPKWLGPRSATLVGLSLYQLEKKLHHPVHPTFGRKAGFHAEFIKAQDCKTANDLANAILASSCTPPFTSVQYPGRKPALDGGMVDNVPVEGIEQWEANYSNLTKTLVLLTRPYKDIPTHSKRVYAQPSEKVPANSWDYTNPDNLQLTYEQGKRDADNFLRKHL